VGGEIEISIEFFRDHLLASSSFLTIVLVFTLNKVRIKPCFVAIAISEGHTYAVNMDLARFFDTVNHRKLIEILSRTGKDRQVISLVIKYLNAGVAVVHKFELIVLS